jgi:hypothetical protein
VREEILRSSGAGNREIRVFGRVIGDRLGSLNPGLIPENQTATSSKGPIMPGKGVRPHETPDHQEGKQEGQENLVVLVVRFPVKKRPLVGIESNFNPHFFRNRYN